MSGLCPQIILKLPTELASQAQSVGHFLRAMWCGWILRDLMHLCSSGL